MKFVNFLSVVICLFVYCNQLLGRKKYIQNVFLYILHDFHYKKDQTFNWVFTSIKLNPNQKLF